MADACLWLLFLLCGIHGSMKAAGIQLVGIPSDTELTQAFINSERLHTGDVSATVTVRNNSKGFTAITVDVPGTPNATVSGTVNLNKIVDGLLDSLRVDIKRMGKDRINVPDIDETFTKKVFFIKVKGEFKGENGWVESLSTIRRTADVVASSYGEWISVSCGFGLDHLEVGYDRYRAKFMKIGPRGKINAIIGKNSILMKATVSWANHKCNMTVNELILDRFGDISMKITGLGPMNWMFSKISTCVLQHFKSEIKDTIESTLREVIEKQLSHFDCSKFFPKV